MNYVFRFFYFPPSFIKQVIMGWDKSFYNVLNIHIFNFTLFLKLNLKKKSIFTF